VKTGKGKKGFGEPTRGRRAGCRRRAFGKGDNSGTRGRLGRMEAEKRKRDEKIFG